MNPLIVSVGTSFYYSFSLFILFFSIIFAIGLYQLLRKPISNEKGVIYYNPFSRLKSLIVILIMVSVFGIINYKVCWSHFYRLYDNGSYVIIEYYMPNQSIFIAKENISLEIKKRKKYKSHIMSHGIGKSRLIIHDVKNHKVYTSQTMIMFEALEALEYLKQ